MYPPNHYAVGLISAGEDYSGITSDFTSNASIDLPHLEHITVNAEAKILKTMDPSQFLTFKGIAIGIIAFVTLLILIMRYSGGTAAIQKKIRPSAGYHRMDVDEPLVEDVFDMRPEPVPKDY